MINARASAKAQTSAFLARTEDNEDGAGRDRHYQNAGRYIRVEMKQANEQHSENRNDREVCEQSAPRKRVVFEDRDQMVAIRLDPAPNVSETIMTAATIVSELIAISYSSLRSTFECPALCIALFQSWNVSQS